MSRNDQCSVCQRPLRGPDKGCARCARPPIPDQTIRLANELAHTFAETHAGDPWLRSAGLLAYSLRSRRRGFLDDRNQPFTRAALRFLWELSALGDDAGISPLAETAIHEGLHHSQPVLAAALHQLLDQYRALLATPGNEFDGWYSRL